MGHIKNWDSRIPQAESKPLIMTHHFEDMKLTKSFTNLSLLFCLHLNMTELNNDVNLEGEGGTSKEGGKDEKNRCSSSGGEKRRRWCGKVDSKGGKKNKTVKQLI